MPPFESVKMRSRKHVCYVIEEEQTIDAEIASCDSQVENKLRYKHCNSVLSESEHNISKLCNKREDFVTSCRNKEHDSLCSEFKDVSSSVKGDDSFHGDFSSGTFSDIDRGQDNLSIVTQLPSLFSINQERTLRRDDFLVKSGVLVLVSSGQSQRSQFTNRSRHAESVSSFPPRCATIVKIHRKGFEKYAVVTSARRHLITSSLFLKLKNSHVTQSSPNPSQFVVFIQGITEQAFTFEASSPELAKQWIAAFTVDSSCSRMVSHYRERPCKSRELYPQRLTDDGRALNDNSLHRCTASFPAKQDSPLLPVLSESFMEDDEEINR